MTGEPAQEPQTRRAVVVDWGLLVVRVLARGYLVFLVALAACATLPMAFGLTGTVVQSGSMMPHIAIGDVVLSQPLSADAPTPLGRVVTFRAPAGSAEPGIRLHRIVGINPDGSLITAGDANRDVDSAPLARADIIAVSCLLIPWIGLPAYWLQHGLLVPFAAWIAVTLLALVIEFLASRGETRGRGDRRSGHSRPPYPGIRTLAGRIGPESALSVMFLFLCAAMVAIAPIVPAASAAFTGSTTNAANNWVASTALSPAKLAFTTNPSNSTGGIAFGIQPVVAIQTSSGSSTISTAPVTLSISTPAGATLSCSANPVAAASGTGGFSGCTIDKAGTYTLTATSPGLSSAISGTVVVSVGAASKLVFTTSPSNAARNVAFTTQPVVAVQDAGGNTVTSSTAPVALTIAKGKLVCTSNPKNAVAGVAAFDGCRINQAGSYVLTASSASLQSGVSSTFFIFTTPRKLAFTTSPSSALSGAAFDIQPTVAIQDASGNTTSGTTSITLSITTPAGATLSCAANPKAAVNGTATFSGCAIGKAGTYTLTATAFGLSSATSASFTISAGPATRLSFTSSPSNSVRSITFATQPVVAVLDAFGNTTTSTASVTLAITNPAGATLNCMSNPKAAVSGVAAFSGCSIDRAGIYTLRATSSPLTPGVSASFVVI
ncbi:S26 family signal peptidase [Gryllotalpicola sp.]|uniref:S26 family signal peptidase n=1 Tax=Gryllotalpicola sp. TaxID=1932787 RepID=UPI002631E80E|nr:S26 family signal peptidase [Gryllotalpicola sp.]